MRRRGRRLIGLCALALLTFAPAAHASLQQESMFQDDSLLVYSSPTVVARTLDQLAALGVNRIRVSVFWNVIAPASQSMTRPAGFDASDPAAYPAAGWAHYDTVLRDALAHGIGVNFDLTSPAPYWATSPSPRADIQKNFNPSASEFQQFAQAVGTRYSGHYTPPGASGPLPRVNYWSIWNEPNQPGWLNPQWTGSAGHYVAASPRIYRNLLDAAWSGLSASGHGSDTILIGETAPKGDNARGLTRAIKPVPFIQSLYCLGGNFRPLTGAAATSQGCPARFSAASFVAGNPGLFEATGFAHHPYEFTFSPSFEPKDSGFITIANLPRLTNELSAILSVYHRSRPGGLPLYLTEFGYITNPPSPLGVTLSQQQAYMDQAEFIAYNNPNVRTLSQFLLMDALPKPGVSDPLQAYGGTFQTGLLTAAGKPKPAFYTYRLPVYLPATSTVARRSLRVWGMVRPDPDGMSATVAIQFRARGRSAFSNLRRVATGTSSHYVDTRVVFPGSGQVRLAWTPPHGGAGSTIYSRVVGVAVGGGSRRRTTRRG